MQSNGKIITALLAVLTVIAAGIVLKAAISVVLPLVIAWLLSYILAPIVRFLTSHKIPYVIAVTLVLLLVLGVFYLGGMFLFARIKSFVAVSGEYEAQLREIVRAATARLSLPKGTMEEVQWGQEISKQLVKISGSLVTFTSYLVKIIIFLIFLLLGKPYFKYKIQKAMPDRAGTINEISASISRQIGRYLSALFVISAATGVLVWLVLTWLDVDFAATWGATAFLLNFIPTIGSIIATIPPVLVALVQYYPDPWVALIALAAIAGIQLTIGNIIAPKIMGDRLDMSPVVVLISLVFWGWLWGFTGALLSVPIAASIKIVCENIEPLKPIGILMGSGRAYYKEMSDAS